MSLRYFITISGIFRKSDDELDILPPPPPFPDIEKEDERINEAKKILKNVEKQKQKELGKKKKNGGKKAREKKVFEFFHGLGLVKTKKEKKEIERNKERKRKHEEGKQKEEEKKRQRELAKQEKERKKIEDARAKEEEKQKPGKGTILEGIFIKKKEASELDKELEELEKEILPTKKKERLIETKIELPELGIPEIEELEKELEKPGEIVKAEKEIQRAISGMEKAREKKVFEFFHSVGLVRTEKEKKQIEKDREKRKKAKELERKKSDGERRKKEIGREKQREEDRRQKELRLRAKDERKRIEAEEKRKSELEKQRKLERKRKEEEVGRELEEQKQKELRKEKSVEEKKSEKGIFLRGIFGKKKEKTEIDKELEELEKKILPTKKKEMPIETKTELPELGIPDMEELGKEIAKPGDVIKAEEEIQKAISGMKKGIKKKPSALKRLFKKKKPAEDTVGKVEMPEVMPRTYDKIDHVLMIEERIHKARMLLMDFKFDEAKNEYIDIIEVYNNLNAKEKARVYNDINELYYERKGAEKFIK